MEKQDLKVVLIASFATFSISHIILPINSIKKKLVLNMGERNYKNLHGGLAVVSYGVSIWSVIKMEEISELF